MNETIDTQLWQRYIENEIGLVLPKAQKRWLKNAIASTAKNNKLTVTELWEAVKQDANVRQQLLDSALIIESRFFRHLPSLNYIATLAQRHEQASASDKLSSPMTAQPFRIWSVGCSTGQEVWSLAMMLQSCTSGGYQLLGSDVSRQALITAKQAVYHPRERMMIPDAYQKFIKPAPAPTAQQGGICEQISTQQMMTKSANNASDVMQQGWFQVQDALRIKADFEYHNVFMPQVPTLEKQQVIVCQNMLIYFRQFDQRDILGRLVAQCEVGGHLVLAPGEALFWQHPKMQRLVHPQVNVWQKIAS